MMKAIPLLFLLDFSGSMDQIFEKKIKSDMLKTNIQGIFETARPNENIEAIIYGTHPEKKCKDFVTLNGKPEVVKKQVMETQPGPFGKTPLAQGLKRVVARSIELQASHIITMTDGGDSCGEDPCKALIEANDQLKKNDRTMSLFLIAFDLKKDKKKFQCFKNLKLSNLKISLSEASNESDIYDQIIKANNESLGADVGIDPKQNEGNLNQTDKGQGRNGLNRTHENETKNSSSEATGKKNNRNKSDTTNAPEHEADPKPVLEITGAPAQAEFTIEGEKGNRAWHGAFAIQLEPGKYKVTFVDPFGLSLEITLKNGDVRRIPWGQLMKNAKSLLTLKDITLGISLKPQEKTLKVHGDLKEINVSANILDSTARTEEIPFGEWNISVVNPIWLKEALPEKKITIPRGSSQQEAIQTAYKENVQWVKNPYPTEMVVLEIKWEDKRTERFLLTPGQRMIPLPLKTQAHFLLGNNK